MSCNLKSQSKYQEWPKTGLLYNNFNLPLKKLQSGLSKIPTDIEDAVIYSYVIKTIKKNNNGSFVQTGCGPNFEGDVITLCTCKHFMRTYGDINFWKNKWIAGFRGVRAREKKNDLVYLMPVWEAFESYSDLWNSKILTDKAKKQKNSHDNKLGDLYKPKKSLEGTQRFQVKNYQVPHQGHAHFKNEEWHKDIDIKYPSLCNRRPVLLVGDRRHSFLWSQPTIYLLPKDKLGKGDVGRSVPKKNIVEFLQALKKW